jgi:hypothetical protein
MVYSDQERIVSIQRILRTLEEEGAHRILLRVGGAVVHSGSSSSSSSGRTVGRRVGVCGVKTSVRV